MERAETRTVCRDAAAALARAFGNLSGLSEGRATGDCRPDLRGADKGRALPEAGERATGGSRPYQRGGREASRFAGIALLFAVAVATVLLALLLQRLG